MPYFNQRRSTSKTSLNVYRSVVRSKIEYSKTTTANSPQYIKKKVERLIDMIKRSLGVPKSSPTLVVYTLAGELPPAHRAQFLTAKRSVGWSYEIQISYDIIADNPLVRLIFPTEIPHIRTNLLAFTSHLQGACSLQNAWFWIIWNRCVGQRQCYWLWNLQHLQETKIYLQDWLENLLHLWWVFCPLKGSSDCCGRYHIVACRALATVNSDYFRVGDFHNILQDLNIKRCYVIWRL